MSIDLDQDEAELLIAALTFAEGAALAHSPELIAIVAGLRAFRSRLLATYVGVRYAGEQP